MTDKDKSLIKEAERMSPVEWPEVLELSRKADTEEARKALRIIALMLHNREERMAGHE